MTTDSIIDPDVVGPPPELHYGHVKETLVRYLGRELVRGLIALITLLLVCGTVYLSYQATRQGHWSDAKDWLQTVLPAETAILGSALGFYFGSQSGKSGCE